MNINLLSIDIAKNVFQLCGVTTTGKIVKECRVSRAKLLATVRDLSPKLVSYS